MQNVSAGCMMSLVLLLVAAIILFVMTGPPGWILAALFAIAAAIAAGFKSINWKARSKKHGAEDIDRGSGDDQMYQ